jgi:hypothetical protein
VLLLAPRVWLPSSVGHAGYCVHAGLMSTAVIFAPLRVTARPGPFASIRMALADSIAVPQPQAVLQGRRRRHPSLKTVDSRSSPVRRVLTSAQPSGCTRCQPANFSVASDSQGPWQPGVLSRDPVPPPQSVASLRRLASPSRAPPVRLSTRIRPAHRVVVALAHAPTRMHRRILDAVRSSACPQLRRISHHDRIALSMRWPLVHARATTAVLRRRTAACRSSSAHRRPALHRRPLRRRDVA